MKQGIHPNYREVIFFDTSSETKFVTRSTMETPDTMEHEGTTYPLIKVDVSSASHPFYTGGKTHIKAAGRVEKFNSRYAARKK